MNLLRRLSLAALLAGVPLLHADNPAARVVLLANRDDPDSVRIARHYADVRGVPAANIIALPMSREETIGWAEFVGTVWQPLQDELVRRGWIDAIAMDLKDAVGRRKYAMSGHRLSYLVVCRGVPLRIEHDPALYAPAPPFTDRVIFRTNAAAVDSELSLLAQTGQSINGFVPNPLFRNDHVSMFDRAQVVKVSRLDGPTAAAAMALVDHAVEAERTGLLGRAYVDLGGNSPEGDHWLESVEADLGELGFDTDVDHAGTTMPATARFDAPVLYFGWYAPRLNGPFALPGFRFPPGAVAVHIHSYSAATLRSADANWCGPLVARGVTATVGNVFEPYLQFTHRPDLMLRALARGDTFGDAVYYAEPVLSWQAMAVGDPLYRPFAVRFADQWRRRAALPAELEPYAVLRRMRRLEDADRRDDALAVARSALREHPGLAVSLALADLLEQGGDRPAAAAALAAVPLRESLRPDEWALAHEAALTLQRTGAPVAAVGWFRRLLADPALPRDLRIPWLNEARESALAAGDRGQAALWRDELDNLIGSVRTP